MFTQVEKDRLCEVLFFLYFDKQDPENISKAEFWNTIINICGMYGINGMAVSRAARMLFADTNKPSDIETWYLLNKMGLSVRSLRKVSGIYWQKQQHFAEIVEKYGPPAIHRVIVDAAMKCSVRDFIIALYKTFGIFTVIDEKRLTETFKL